MNHNRRVFIASNVDPERTKDNMVLADESLEDAYASCFGDSIEVSNRSQTRKDRLLTPEKYLKKIKKGEDKENNPKSCYEMIIQVGDMNTAGFKANPVMAEKAKEVLIDFTKQLQKDTQGHMHIVGAYLHLDESTPHIHIDYFPLAHGYKKGMPVRNALGKALQEMGYVSQNKKVNSVTAWQCDLRDKLVEICKAHGIEASWSRHDVSEEHLTVADHKKLMRIADRKMAQALENYHKSGLKDRLFGKADNHVKAAYAAAVLRDEAGQAELMKLREVANDRAADNNRRSAEQDARAASLDARERSFSDEVTTRQAELDRKEKEQHERLAAEEKEHQDKMAAEDAELNERLAQVRRIAEKAEADKKAAEEMTKKAAADRAEAKKALDKALEIQSGYESQKQEIAEMSSALHNEQVKFYSEKVKWVFIEEANRDAQKARAERDALQKKYDSEKADWDVKDSTWEKKYNNAVNWAQHYRNLYEREQKANHNLSNDLTVARNTIKAQENSLSDQKKDFDNKLKYVQTKHKEELDIVTSAKDSVINDAFDEIANKSAYINVLRSEQAALHEIFENHSRDFSVPEEATIRVYAELSDNARDNYGISKEFNAIVPSPEALQKQAHDVNRERNRERNRNRGMSR